MFFCFFVQSFVVFDFHIFLSMEKFDTKLFGNVNHVLVVNLDIKPKRFLFGQVVKTVKKERIPNWYQSTKLLFVKAVQKERGVMVLG